MAQVVLHTDSQKDSVKLSSNNLSFKSIEIQQTKTFENLYEHQSRIQGTLDKVVSIENRMTKVLQNLSDAVDLMNELEYNIYFVKWGNPMKTGIGVTVMDKVYDKAYEMGKTNESTALYNNYASQRRKAGYVQPLEAVNADGEKEDAFTTTCNDSVEVTV